MTTIFWAGDSTVKQNSIATYPQTGIGQMFHRYVRNMQVQIENHAENGRSTKSFMDESRLAIIYDRIKAGDFLFIQFGHNDEKPEDPTRYADPESEFPANLERFVNAARNKGAIPVFITPLTRWDRNHPAAKHRHDEWAESYRRTAKKLSFRMTLLPTGYDSAAVTFEYAAGETYRWIGEPFQPARHTWVGVRLALFAMPVDGGSHGGHADFGAFTVEPVETLE